MTTNNDGPTSSLFKALKFRGNATLATIDETVFSEDMAAALQHAPDGRRTFWGIPFHVDSVALLSTQAVTIKLNSIKTPWLVFMHVADLLPQLPNKQGFYDHSKGQGSLGDCAATYLFRYTDGTEVSVPIRRRHQIAYFQEDAGETCLQAVSHLNPIPLSQDTEFGWIFGQMGQHPRNWGPEAHWLNWLWAWENPHPNKAIKEIVLQPGSGPVLLSAISKSSCKTNPLLWQRRKKVLVSLANTTTFDPVIDEQGCHSQFELDMGQIISVEARASYPKKGWASSSVYEPPKLSTHTVLLEYTAHPEALLHLVDDGKKIPLNKLGKVSGTGVKIVTPADQRVTIKIVEKGSRKRLAAKLHLHGQEGEYLAPLNRRRKPSKRVMEHNSPDWIHENDHVAAYIDGETVVDLPLGTVYVELTKGFEYKPIRKAITIKESTKTITLTLERVLDWRGQGWVTADTHVHFLNPVAGMLEGAAEGINVVNLLVMQMGEAFSNVGEFDGKTTWGSEESGGDGEYLLRVGTENRQHILGHISLLGYKGNMIVPLSTGGPAESPIGDPLDCSLAQWARQCQEQGGLVICPHFPDPRMDGASVIVDGSADAVEMHLLPHHNFYAGISPYSLSDWYRYLNCGYQLPIVGGTDKMDAKTALGCIRTYTRIRNDEFTYDNWMQAVRQGETFATCGSLLDFSVEGKAMGSSIPMSNKGGTVAVNWKVASCTVPSSRVELICNGEIIESKSITGKSATGIWNVRVDRSSWLALLVRGHFPGRPEVITAHSSSVFIACKGSPFFSAADAVTILDQIEGAQAYLETIGVRTVDRRFKAMQLALQATHRKLHNLMHQNGVFHDHSTTNQHHEPGEPI
ncbi:MAG: CehA/McbA family metallohydrolase [Lentisphaeria bacterium]|nr:CehA/McbA family metallohydrolase [Lentisphaeria bacterium]NQZ68108.1 CehA/McbA family metallohydrolase [Lentisphaeria bacterium]